MDVDAPAAGMMRCLRCVMLGSDQVHCASSVRGNRRRQNLLDRHKLAVLPEGQHGNRESDRGWHWCENPPVHTLSADPPSDQAPHSAELSFVRSVLLQ